MPPTSRRQFVQSCAASLAASSAAQGVFAEDGKPAVKESFEEHQKVRRDELWSLLGDLPVQKKPPAPRVVSTEKHDGYTLERLALDLNGIEPAPALLLIPDKRQSPIHWHGGMYSLGKEQLLRGVDVQPAYAPVCVEKGLVTLAIDSWCFGERKHDTDGKRGEEDTFKRMLWNGQVLYGMMMYDEFRALDYLANRPEVDSKRLGCPRNVNGGNEGVVAGSARSKSTAVCRCVLPDRLRGTDPHEGFERTRNLLLRTVADETFSDGRDQRVNCAATAAECGWAEGSTDTASGRGENT